ncbi:MAG: hypothetical protein ACOYL6_15455 [Bacteriovoracaceae bacterium]
MKFFILFLGLIFCSFANAATSIVALGNNKVLVKDPVFPGTQSAFAFVAWNCPGNKCASGSSFTPARPQFYGADNYLNEQGVCKALGFLKAEANTSYSLQGSNSTPRIQVDDAGIPTGAVAGRSLSGIVCYKMPESKNIIITITNPVDRITLFPYSLPDANALNISYACGNVADVASNEDAVCAELGYGKAVPASSLADQQCPKKRIAVQAVYLDGKLTKTVVESAHPIESIMCFTR